MAQNVCFIALAKSVNDDDIDTTSMLTANTDEEIPKEVLATHVSSQDMESIIRLCKEGRMQDALMVYDEIIKKGLVPNLQRCFQLTPHFQCLNNWFR